jgi:hypothetical protein
MDVIAANLANVDRRASGPKRGTESCVMCRTGAGSRS